ncbi:tetratricopeptide repeat protein [bacterium]|nr:tetratricopeptide repeat protein [bacterium]
MIKASFKNLLDRRVPHILGAYLGGSVATVGFVDLLINRYALSHHLMTFCLVLLVSLIPTVLLLAYLHGKSGRDKWTKIEKIGIPTNFLFTVLLLILIFHGKGLGATTRTVTVTDEEGKQIERVIPKSEFRRSVALFNFDNRTGNSELDWLQYGFTLCLDSDLSQDLFLETKSAFGFDRSMYHHIAEAGFSEGVELPFTLKRKIAKEFHMRYFLSGDFTQSDNQLMLNSSLYETERGKLVAENRITGDDIFSLIDTVTIQLKRDLDIPKHHLQGVEDLPVSEIITASVDALRLTTLGLKAWLFQNDLEVVPQYLEKSIQEDPTFAFAHYMLGAFYTHLSQNEKAIKGLEKAMQYIYKLPESLQFGVKDFYFQMKGEPEKRVNLLKMRVELYPDDIKAHEELAYVYRTKDQLDKAIAEYEKIMTLTPQPYNYYHVLSDIYLKQGQIDEALKYVQRYAEQFPKESRSFIELAGLYKHIGDYQQAKSHYERALLIEAGNISVLVNLANIEQRLGNFNQALVQYERALAESKTPKDKAEVYARLAGYYELRGEMEKSLEYMHLKWSEWEKKYKIPLLVSVDKLMYDDIHRYVKAGKEEVAFQTLKEMAPQFKPPFDTLPVIGYMSVYIALEDADNVEKLKEDFDDMVRAFGDTIGNLQFLNLSVEGKVLELKGKYEEALLNYQKMLELYPSYEEGINIEIGRCYRNLKELKKAEEALQKTSKVLPFYPDAHYEIALVYSDMGDREKALEHLKMALEVWKDADAEYKPAKRAREKLAEWQP